MESDGGDRDILDLEAYRRRRPDGRRAFFAVWGGDGERARFALPVWRAIYLTGCERGAVVWTWEWDDDPAVLHPIFVLDLAREEPRTSFSVGLLGELRSALEAPALHESIPGGVAVFLGCLEDKRLFLVTDDGGGPRKPVDASARNDLLFAAGECMGLVTHRELHISGDEGAGPDGRPWEGVAAGPRPSSGEFPAAVEEEEWEDVEPWDLGDEYLLEDARGGRGAGNRRVIPLMERGRFGLGDPPTPIPEPEGGAPGEEREGPGGKGGAEESPEADDEGHLRPL